MTLNRTTLSKTEKIVLLSVEVEPIVLCCNYSVCLFTDHHAESSCADYNYTECCYTVIIVSVFTLSVILVSVFTLSVILVSVIIVRVVT
jgi:hypothetical protein